MRLTEKMIEKLETKGFVRWTKGSYDRLYINATVLGLELDYYKTGNISGAWFNGNRISNSQGYRYKAAKTYIDIETGRLRSDIYELTEAAQKLIDEAAAEIEAEEKAAEAEAAETATEKESTKEKKGGATMIIKNAWGTEIDFDAAVMLMDDEIREQLANNPPQDDGWESEQEFFLAYAAAHLAKFGEEFEPAKKNPVW